MEVKCKCEVIYCIFKHFLLLQISFMFLKSVKKIWKFLKEYFACLTGNFTDCCVLRSFQHTRMLNIEYIIISLTFKISGLLFHPLYRTYLLWENQCTEEKVFKAFIISFLFPVARALWATENVHYYSTYLLCLPKTHIPPPSTNFNSLCQRISCFREQETLFIS